MSAVRHIFDGLQSIVVGVLTLTIVGIPAWFAHVAASNELAPSWIYVPILALGFFGTIMAIAFLRKGFSGVAPLRERRRR